VWVCGCVGVRVCGCVGVCEGEVGREGEGVCVCESVCVCACVWMFVCVFVRMVHVCLCSKNITKYFICIHA